MKSKLNRNKTPPTKFDHPQLQISRRNIVTFSQLLLSFCLGITNVIAVDLLPVLPCIFLPSLLIEWHIRAFVLGMFVGDIFLLMAAFEFM